MKSTNTHLTIAVTGMNATDNPAPGVPVIRAIRDGVPNVTTIGLAYDALDPGCYMGGVCDHVYLMPYPSQGADVMLDRLRAIHRQTPIDVLIPCLDAELSAYIKMEDDLRDMGIAMMLPDEASLELRSKARLTELDDRFGIRVPKSLTLTDRRSIATIQDTLRYPVMVKGQFYDAYIAYSALEVGTWFDRMAAKWGLPVIVQEYVAGTEFDIVAVGDGDGGLIGHVPMRKMQLTDKGKAWGGITVTDSDLDEFVRRTVGALSWSGPCELEVMREHDTGDLYLIEINPRFPAWVYLTVGAGRNLPAAVVQLALGRNPRVMDPAPAGVMFLRHSYDQIVSLSDFSSMTTLGELSSGQSITLPQTPNRRPELEIA
jgi:carbamoyl-phosphate synthase large subunit